MTNTYDSFLRNDISRDTRYQYEIIGPEHLDGVVEMFTRAFCAAEPMTHYLNMQYDTYAPFAQSVTEQAIKDGWSIVALDRGKVAACALVKDLAEPQNISSNFDEKLTYIAAFLEKLGGPFFQGKIIPKKSIAHLLITAVDEKYRRQGLSTQVNLQVMNLAALSGFDFVYCGLTHIYNEKGLIPHLKNNKKLIGSCAYQDFVYGDKKPFEYLAGGANAYLWEIVTPSNIVKKSKSYQAENDTIIVCPFMD